MVVQWPQLSWTPYLVHCAGQTGRSEVCSAMDVYLSGLVEFWLGKMLVIRIELWKLLLAMGK
jgi:hypothetical protein